MSAISSRYLPADRVPHVMAAVEALFSGRAIAIHEVDAHVLCVHPHASVEATRLEDAATTAYLKSCWAGHAGGRTFRLLCTDNMCGQLPLAAVVVSVELLHTGGGELLVLTVADYRELRLVPSLPYRLRRALVQGVASAFWEEVDRHAGVVAPPLPQAARRRTG